MKISDNVANEPAFYDDPDEETYFLVSNHHSREWMTIPTVMYFIHYLTYYYEEGPIDNDGDGLINEDMIDFRSWDGLFKKPVKPPLLYLPKKWTS